MKRTIVQLALAGIVAAFWVPGTALGQAAGTGEDDSARKTPGDPEPSRAEESDQPSGPNDRIPPSMRGRERPRERARHWNVISLKRLQAAMKQQLDLTRKQTVAVDQLFDEYTQRLKEQRKAPHNADESGTAEAQELKALRDELVKARKAGDVEAVRRARAALGEKMRARVGRASALTDELVKKLGEQLNEEQRPKFQRIAFRLGIGERRGPAGIPLRRLSRALMRPVVGLSAEQQRSVRAIIREGFNESLAAGSDAQKAKEVTARVQAKVFEKLTPEQRAKVEAELEKPERLRARRGRPGEGRGRRGAEVLPPGKDDAPPKEQEPPGNDTPDEEGEDD